MLGVNCNCSTGLRSGDFYFYVLLSEGLVGYCAEGLFQCPSLELVKHNRFVSFPCVGSFTSPGIDIRYKGPTVFSLFLNDTGEICQSF